MKLNLFTQKFLHVFIIDKMGIENFYDDKIITARKIKENAIQYRGRMKMKRKRKKGRCILITLNSRGGSACL